MSQKAISLPSSPHEFRSQATDRGGTSGYKVSPEAVSTWNKVLESPMFQNKPLLPFQEWNIDYRELTVGTRVGIGKLVSSEFSMLHFLLWKPFWYTDSVLYLMLWLLNSPRGTIC